MSFHWGGYFYFKKLHSSLKNVFNLVQSHWADFLNFLTPLKKYSKLKKMLEIKNKYLMAFFKPCNKW